MAKISASTKAPMPNQILVASATAVLAMTAVAAAMAVGGQTPAAGIAPERATVVMVSNRDVNRVHCTGVVDDVIWSKEKPVTVRQEGSDVWVKFLVLRAGNAESRASAPLDLHITCNGEVYSLILHPRDLDTVTVPLGDATRDALATNAKSWGGLALEEKIKRLTLAVYRNDVPSSFTRRRIEPGEPRRNISLFENADIIGQQEVTATGVGLRATEYVVLSREAVELNERDFLNPVFGEIVGITIDPLKVPADGFARLIVIERSTDHGRP